MRSVIKQGDGGGIAAIVAQQFDVGQQVMAAGLVSILEPEVDIHCPDKTEAETMLKGDIMANLANLAADQLIMLKLTLPEQDNLYHDVIEHSNVLKVVALSGGYTRAEANERLDRQNGMVASFSRALSEGLTAQQSGGEFNAMLDGSIASIFAASRT